MWAGGTPVSWLPTEERPGKREGAAKSGAPVAPLKRSPDSKMTWTPTSSTYPDRPSPATPLKSSATAPGNPVCYLPPQRKTRLINLIGERCLIQCSFDDVPVEALWDTGAQASIINEEWRKTHLPHCPIRPIEELLGPGTLVGLAANQTQKPF